MELRRLKNIRRFLNISSTFQICQYPRPLLDPLNPRYLPLSLISLIFPHPPNHIYPLKGTQYFACSVVSQYSTIWYENLRILSINKNLFFFRFRFRLPQNSAFFWSSASAFRLPLFNFIPLSSASAFRFSKLKILHPCSVFLLLKS